MQKPENDLQCKFCPGAGTATDERCGSSMVIEVAQLTIAPSYSSKSALENSVSSRIRPFAPKLALTSMTVYFSSSAPLMETPLAGYGRCFGCVWNLRTGYYPEVGKSASRTSLPCPERVLFRRFLLSMGRTNEYRRWTMASQKQRIVSGLQ